MKELVLASAIFATFAFAGGGFGKYDFMPTTGAELCKKAPVELDCCGGAWENPKNGMMHGGKNWRIGKNAGICQEKMYEAYLFDKERVLKK